MLQVGNEDNIKLNYERIYLKVNIGLNSTAQKMFFLHNSGSLRNPNKLTSLTSINEHKISRAGLGRRLTEEISEGRGKC